MTKPTKATAKKKSDEAVAIGRAAFESAIAECGRRWQSRWDRPPTVHELVHAFDVCLSANPDAYVADVAPVLAMRAEPPPPPPPIDPGAFEVAFRETGPFGLEEAELYLKSQGLAKSGYGEVQLLLDIKGATLLVDVRFETHRKVPRFDQACDLVRARVLHRWIGKKDVPITSVVLRPMTGLADPITLPWPPPVDA